jgi:DNA polymerase-3 subunit epsilon
MPEPPWRVETDAWLIDPGIPIPDGAAKIHGITTERARAEGRKPGEALDEIRQMLENAMRRGEPIVGMNLPFDLTLFDRDLRRNDCGSLTLQSRPFGPFVDVYVLDKEIDRFRKGKRTLQALCDHYRVRLDGAHDATFDTVAACRLAWRIVTSSPVLMKMNAWQLHQAQIGWRAGQQASLRAHFEKNNRADDAATVKEAWPILPG